MHCKLYVNLQLLFIWQQMPTGLGIVNIIAVILFDELQPDHLLLSTILYY